MLIRGFIIIDFGSQFTQLIARRLREMGFFSEIVSYQTPAQDILKKNPFGIILSGGPNSVYDLSAPQFDLSSLGQSPILGICYGMQLICHQLGGKVVSSSHREYGYNKLKWSSPHVLNSTLGTVWMSHGDVVEKVPKGFEVLALSESDHIAMIASTQYLAVQFHPEVAHTENGVEVLKYFADIYCKAQPNWDQRGMLEQLKKEALEQVSNEDHIIMGLSGGVDSTVVAQFLTNLFGKERVHCIFINNGLLRKNEYQQVMQSYQALDLNVKGVDATSEFLNALEGLIDPELKRKAIGRVFVEVFEKCLPQIPQAKWLAQGTLYPDVIESVSSVGGSVTIKSHHNVGGLPDRMKLKVLEPVRLLFKDEVRSLGRALKIPENLIQRHPFPGPGLSIRVLGEVTEEKLKILRDCDDIFLKMLHEEGLYHKIWQAFCVLLPVKSVGVQGDGRTYSYVLSLRAVTSVDGMTADWFSFETSFLRKVSNQITNQVHGVNRVVYDVTSKPPGTIEWE